jgi:hypothetical protein
MKVVQFKKEDGGVIRGHCCRADASLEQLLSLKDAMSRDNGDSVTRFEYDRQ